MKQICLVVLALLLLTACGGGSSLADDDPHGYEACSALAKLQTDTDARNKMNGLNSAGEEAAKASNKAIRASTKALFDAEAMDALEGTPSEGQNFYIADPDKLKKACSDAGFEF